MASTKTSKADILAAPGLRGNPGARRAVYDAARIFASTFDVHDAMMRASEGSGFVTHKIPRDTTKGWIQNAWAWAAGFVGGFTLAGAFSSALTLAGAPSLVGSIIGSAATSVTALNLGAAFPGPLRSEFSTGASIGSLTYAAVQLAGPVYDTGSKVLGEIQQGIGEIQDAIGTAQSAYETYLDVSSDVILDLEHAAEIGLGYAPRVPLPGGVVSGGLNEWRVGAEAARRAADMGFAIGTWVP